MFTIEKGCLKLDADVTWGNAPTTFLEKNIIA